MMTGKSLEKKHRILLAEDDTNLGFVVRDNLEHRGLDVVLYSDGEEALQAFAGQRFDLCLLDVMLPKLDGFCLAREIRKRDTRVPIIFLTAKGLKEDKINGFTIGADDYITKPFNIEELLLRIRVFLKRSAVEGNNNRKVLGAYFFDYDNLELLHTEAGIKKLTRKEADLLQLLCTNIGTMVKREEILRQVWETDDYFAGRSMDVFISRLRKMLSSDPTLEIVNYHGTGFKLKVADRAN